MLVSIEKKTSILFLMIFIIVSQIIRNVQQRNILLLNGLECKDILFVALLLHVLCAIIVITTIIVTKLIAILGVD